MSGDDAHNKTGDMNISYILNMSDNNTIKIC